MQTPKRSLHQISPDFAANNSAKRTSKMSAAASAHCPTAANAVPTGGASTSDGANYAVLPATTIPTTTADCFSWSMFDMKLNNVLDAKLENIVKKDDIAPITIEIQQLRKENIDLKNEVHALKGRLEQIDKVCRRNNIVLSGVSCNNVSQALAEFNRLCKQTLKVAVNVVEIRKLISGKSFLLTLNSAMEVNAVLSNRINLRGSNIYIDKDYTTDVRNKRFFLRQFGRNIKKADNTLKVRIGDHRIFINDKPFTCSGEQILAFNKTDAVFLQNLVDKASLNFTIVVNASETSSAAGNGDVSNFNNIN